MSDIKCPFCQQELEDAEIHSAGLYFCCPNCYNKQKEKDDNYTATPKVWQELIRTRKALDVAVDALKEYANKEHWDFEHFYSLYTYDKAEEAIEQITALEQKDK